MGCITSKGQMPVASAEMDEEVIINNHVSTHPLMIFFVTGSVSVVFSVSFFPPPWLPHHLTIHDKEVYSIQSNMHIHYDIVVVLNSACKHTFAPSLMEPILTRTFSTDPVSYAEGGGFCAGSSDTYGASAGMGLVDTRHT